MSKGFSGVRLLLKLSFARPTMRKMGMMRMIVLLDKGLTLTASDFDIIA